MSKFTKHISCPITSEFLTCYFDLLSRIDSFLLERPGSKLGLSDKKTMETIQELILDGNDSISYELYKKFDMMYMFY